MLKHIPLIFSMGLNLFPYCIMSYFIRKRIRRKQAIMVVIIFTLANVVVYYTIGIFSALYVNLIFTTFVMLKFVF